MTDAMAATRPLSGLRLVPAYLDRPAQEALLTALRAVFARAPLYTPRMPKSGKPLSVRMTNCGPFGWVTDEAGYRYQPLHPHTGQPWPAMPDIVIEAWKSLAGYPHTPECCLINYYGGAAKMGLHQDRDELDFEAPVVSLSLGDTCLFRIGGTKRSDPTRTMRLTSGHPGHVDPVAGRRADQPHAAAGDAVNARTAIRLNENKGAPSPSGFDY